MNVLNVQVAAPGAASARAAETMKALAAGEPAQPHFAISFESLAQMLAIFTPKRLELLAALREQGPLTVAALARALDRDYKNVHGDVAALMEWLAVEREESGRVFVPWDEIDFRFPLARAA